MTLDLEPWRRFPALASSVLSRQTFDRVMAAFAYLKGNTVIKVQGGQIYIELFPMTRGPRQLQFHRSVENRGPGYRPLVVYEVDDGLRTDAKTDAEMQFIEEFSTLAEPAITQLQADREARIAAILSKVKPLDREVLSEFLRAIVENDVELTPILDAVTLANDHAVQFIESHPEFSANHGITEPVKNLHVLALLDALPKRSLLSFDYKESMHEVVPMIAQMLQERFGIRLETAPWDSRIEEWDRKSRKTALREIAASIREHHDVALVEVDTSSDSYSVVICSQQALSQLPLWTKRAQLPLKVL